MLGSTPKLSSIDWDISFLQLFINYANFRPRSQFHNKPLNFLLFENFLFYHSEKKTKTFILQLHLNGPQSTMLYVAWVVFSPIYIITNSSADHGCGRQIYGVSINIFPTQLPHSSSPFVFSLTNFFCSPRAVSGAMETDHKMLWMIHKSVRIFTEFALIHPDALVQPLVQGKNSFLPYEI